MSSLMLIQFIYLNLFSGLLKCHVLIVECDDISSIQEHVNMFSSLFSQLKEFNGLDNLYVRYDCSPTVLLTSNQNRDNW